MISPVTVRTDRTLQFKFEEQNHLKVAGNIERRSELGSRGTVHSSGRKVSRSKPVNKMKAALSKAI